MIHATNKPIAQVILSATYSYYPTHYLNFQIKQKYTTFLSRPSGSLSYLSTHQFYLYYILTFDKDLGPTAGSIGLFALPTCARSGASFRPSKMIIRAPSPRPPRRSILRITYLADSSRTYTLRTTKVDCPDSWDSMSFTQPRSWKMSHRFSPVATRVPRPLSIFFDLKVRSKCLHRTWVP